MQQPRAFCRALEWQSISHPNPCPEPTRKIQPLTSKPFPVRFRDLQPKITCSRALEIGIELPDGHAGILAVARASFLEVRRLSSQYRRAAAPGFGRLFAHISASALVLRSRYDQSACRNMRKQTPEDRCG